jgi:hypothetical protein
MLKYIMPGKESPKFRVLSEFTQAYIEAMLWLEEERLAEESENDISFDLIAPESLEKVIRDCEKFQTENRELLSQCGDDSQNAHDFWLTRNRHGAGFWERGYGKAGDDITNTCHKYGEVYVYLGDDGKIHID